MELEFMEKLEFLEWNSSFMNSSSKIIYLFI